MGLRTRIKALEEAIADARKDAHQVARWRTELAAAERQLKAAGHVAHERPLPRYGIDYAWGRPSTAGLHAHGVSFACRYLTGAGKGLTAIEVAELSRAGVDIVSIFELGAQDLAGGAEAGTRQGREAHAAARALRMPHGRPIYFACDFDANPVQVAAVLDYLHAAKVELAGEYLAGIYGGRAVVKAALDTGYHYAWQTLAWSGGQWDARAQLRQTDVTGPVIDGVGCDTNWAYALDFGQWRLPV